MEQQTQFQTFLSGAKRGGKIGAYAAMALMFVVGSVSLTILAIFPEARAEAVADLQKYSDFEIVGGFLGGTALTIAYSAIPGALILGFARLFRAEQDGENRHWRFSLRTLLFATTIIAVVLGLIVFAARN